MKSKIFRELMRWLIMLLGAGLGMALLLGILHLSTLLRPTLSLSLGVLIAAYMGVALVFGLLFYFLSNGIIDKCTEWSAALDRRLDNMPMEQIICCTFGLIAGLLIAALLSQVLTFLGESMFTTAFSAILYVLLGVTGFSLGWRRTADIVPYLVVQGKGSRKAAKEAAVLRAKVLDASALMDGRIFEVYKAGFVEGEMVLPCFVVDEMHRMADSADAARRVRGRRGLDLLQKLQAEGKLPLRLDKTDYDDADVDVKLLRFTRETEAALISSDHTLGKAASAMGIPVLNLNELATALRPTVATGDELTIHIVKEGKEPGQGVAYLDDGTMVVVDGGSRLLGEAAQVTVATVLQTSAGRMVFAKVH